MDGEDVQFRTLRSALLLGCYVMSQQSALMESDWDLNCIEEATLSALEILNYLHLAIEVSCTH